MGVFEPIHGSAPKHAGKNIANPVAAIMTAKMMTNHLGKSTMAFKIEQTVKDVFLKGKVRRHDFWRTSSTTEIGETIAKTRLKIC
jgi:isocitrate/isopropylmalate dehydrogenase